MKKLMAIILAGIMVFSLCACGEEGESGKQGEKGAEALSAETTTVGDDENTDTDVENLFGDCEIGDYIKLGKYEQDNNAQNGKEDIEWLVLDKQDGKILVISKYGLDCRQYNKDNKALTWELSDLRAWLNNEFLNEVFNEYEKEAISLTKVSADKNPKEETFQGEATNDKIFVLSVVETEKYIKTTEAYCTGTAYAFAQGAREEIKDGIGARCKWWTRTIGEQPYKAAFVNFVNNPREYGQEVNNNETAVRPAMWIELD